ncbi:kinase-like protein [Penicillium chrysogenum]|uniref:Kinase-like protein n=1 Tax=Penicillium chrysogenum TaxID=5076 RepID=A0ABQ8W431_PENCH|nr:kinase-like protein [Penicillium chrysogenum]KAJ6153192.1 kinase-like protein [Penicillium chrysogenum]
MLSPVGRETIQGDEEQQVHGDCLSIRDTVITERAVTERAVTERQSDQQLLMIGIFAKVYLLDRKTVRKVPRSESEEDMQPTIREAMIYNTIGVHPRIAECLSRGSDRSDRGDRVKFVDIKFYRHGDLTSYCQKNSITSELQSKWFQQILEAVVVIHSFSVIHSDLAIRQFFVDDNLDLRLGDFNSSQCAGHPALGYEKASHCLPRDYELPNTESTDIFALGSTLYELVAGKAPYSELNVAESDDPKSIKAQIQRQHKVIDFEIEERYKRQQFPDVTCYQRGDVILGCWRGQFATAADALDFYLRSRNTM